MLNLTQTVDSPKTSEWKPEVASENRPFRIASIDILRAITMVLMIFVNDLWSLQNIPVWLEHVSYEADGMGLADTIFPAFLFIVGMSIPLAIANRRKKGDTTPLLLWHIASRTFALLVMGVFLVNGENINAAATGIPRLLWYSLSCMSFILIWNTYPKQMNLWLTRTLQAFGMCILLALAFIYRGGEAENINRFTTYWWGILGLIGWSYLVGAVVTALAGKRYTIILAAWVLFCVLSMLSNADMIPKDSFLKFIPGAILGGTLPALTLGGVLITLLFEHFARQNAFNKMMLVLFTISVGLILLGIYTRTFWGISKLRATPAWLFICSAFTILTFMVIYYIADMRKKAQLFNFIRPAGTDTLLCYLIPYFSYALVNLLGIHWPEFMLTGIVGLIKSFVFALLCVVVTGVLSKNGIRLKL
jgi:heparan-alpha-glucosaminide N-acetyltransferase